MNPPVPTLVVGARGLLGRHVATAVERRAGLALRTVGVPWADPAGAAAVLTATASGLGEEGGERNVLWCAGAGVVATGADVLEQEVRSFEAFLSALPGPGSLVLLSSSAGGVYAGAAGPPFDEHTTPSALVPYGEAKLGMESALRAWCERAGGRAVIGRISNLYGPGQNFHKGQGLISHVCLAHLTRRPLVVQGSFDALRDYIYVEDAAAAVVTAIQNGRDRADALGSAVQTKVFASGKAATIGEIIAWGNQAFRRRMPLLNGPYRPGQVRDLRVRSVEWPELQRYVRTPLPVGINRTAEDVRRRVLAEGGYV